MPDFPLLLALAAGLALAAPVPPALAEGAPAAGAAKPALPAITVTRVRKARLTDRVYASGLVGAVETVQVQPRVAGLAVETVEAEVGDRVEAGQVLARLSTAELELEKSQLEAQRATAAAAIAQAEAQRVQARANADEAERVLKRSRALRESGNLSQSQLDQADAAATTAQAQLRVAEEGLTAARAQLRVAEAQIADIELRLQRTDVVAPVAGEIVGRNVMVGAISSSAAEPMFRIVRDGALEVLGDVAEEDILKLEAGQPATLRFIGAAEPVTGTVRLVEPQVDTATRLGRVRIAIDDPSRVRPGMFASATVIVAEHEALALPVSATSTGSGGTTALKVTEGVVHTTRIATGIRDGELIEILDGLSEGDDVVAKAGAFVRDGDHINPVPADAQVAGR